MYSEAVVEYVAKSLVDHPDDVMVTPIVGEKSVDLRVAGGSGRHGESHRTAGPHCTCPTHGGEAAATRDSKVIHVEIVD